jgi:hypothetical protein
MTSPKRPPTLSKEDARVLDELLEHGGLESERIESLPEEDRQRARKIEGVLSLLDAYPVEDASDDLVHATLARINRAEDERSSRMNIQTKTEMSGQLSGKRWRFPDLFATAAMVLLAVGVIWPVMNHARQSRMIALDHDNMGETYEGITGYASTNNGLSPMESTASLLPDPFDWMTSHSGLHNQLIREQCDDHADRNDFHRPGGTVESDPYSFQVWQPGMDIMSAEQPIMSNTNPLVGLGSMDTPVSRSEAVRNSNSHDRLGQNVLFGDGHIEMLEDCQIIEDRIWDPGSNELGHLIAILKGEIDSEQIIFLIH